MNKELEKANLVATLAHIANVIVFLAFAVYFYIQGDTEIYRPIGMAILGLGVNLAEIITYIKKHDSKMIRHYVAMGYAVFFTFAFFTSVSIIDLMFVIGMCLVVTIYNDEKYVLMINTGVVIENIIIVILGHQNGGHGYINLEFGIIQITTVVLFSIYSFFTARTLRLNNEVKLVKLEEASSKSENAFENISAITESLKLGINEIHENIDKLIGTAKTTGTAMKEVSVGANDTAEAVQTQITQTAEIQDKVDSVNATAESIYINMHETMEALEEGKRNIKILEENTELSVNNSKDAAEKLNTLEMYMSEMYSIVGMIENITEETSLLSLNASIEAARAGEAGRGFAVVASEISSMAVQTQDATKQISDLISNVSGAIAETVSVIYKMIEGINEEKKSTENAVQSFSVIDKNTENINIKVKGLATDVAELKVANQEIVESIQTISAISEEVTARAGETMESEESNIEIMEDIKEQMQVLLDVTNTEQVNLEENQVK